MVSYNVMVYAQLLNYHSKLQQATLYFFILFLQENKAWYFIWIVCWADDSHEISSPLFSQKKYNTVETMFRQECRHFDIE